MYDSRVCHEHSCSGTTYEKDPLWQPSVHSALNSIDFEEFLDPSDTGLFHLWRRPCLMLSLSTRQH